MLAIALCKYTYGSSALQRLHFQAFSAGVSHHGTLSPNRMIFLFYFHHPISARRHCSLQVSLAFFKMKLPRVIGDIIAGCILGPTVLQDIGALAVNPAQNGSAVKTIGYVGDTLLSTWVAFFC